MTVIKLQSVTIPSNLAWPIAAQKAYVAFEWLKLLADDRGRVCKKILTRVDKSRADYWTKKLLGAGWIENGGSHWILRSRRKVWALLGTKKCMRQHLDEIKRKGFHYTQLCFVSKTPSEFFKLGLETIQAHLTYRRKKQLLQRLAEEGRCNGVKKFIVRNEKPQLSCKTAAKLFGYKAPSTGRKYRLKYFKVEQSRIIRPFVNMHGCVSFKRECGKISLR